MNKLLILLALWPLSAFSELPNRPAPNIYNTPGFDLTSMPLGVQGDCKTDDWRALQTALSMHRPVFLPIPPGGCYLVSKTLIMQSGDYLYSESANNPNPGDPGA